VTARRSARGTARAEFAGSWAVRLGVVKLAVVEQRPAIGGVGQDIDVAVLPANILVRIELLCVEALR
jgi:hypothetical protein